MHLHTVWNQLCNSIIANLNQRPNYVCRRMIFSSCASVDNKLSRCIGVWDSENCLCICSISWHSRLFLIINDTFSLHVYVLCDKWKLCIATKSLRLLQIVKVQNHRCHTFWFAVTLHLMVTGILGEYLCLA